MFLVFFCFVCVCVCVFLQHQSLPLQNWQRAEVYETQSKQDFLLIFGDNLLLQMVSGGGVRSTC